MRQLKTAAFIVAGLVAAAAMTCLFVHAWNVQRVYLP